MIVPIYIFSIAFILAYLEVQIEGPNGWAAALPTWRVRNGVTQKVLGVRFLTGYHVALNILLLLFFHLPIVMNGFSWVVEAEALMYFCFISFIWDYLWFIINPFYGAAKRRQEAVWWFDTWWFNYPKDYYFGAIAGLGIRLIPSVVGVESFRDSLYSGAAALGNLILLSGVVTFVYSLMGSPRAVGALDVKKLGEETELP